MNELPTDPEERIKVLRESLYRTLISFFSGGTYNNIFLGLFDRLNENLKKVNTSFDTFSDRVAAVDESFKTLNKNIENADKSSSKLAVSLNIITVVGVVIAGLSFWATWKDTSVNEAAVISQRPYLDLTTPRIEKITESGAYQFTSEIENVGNRPAKNTNIEFYPIATISGEKEPYGFNPGWCDEVTQLSNLVFPHKKVPGIYASGAPQYNDPKPLKYALVRVSYADSILDEEYAQVFYYQWKVNDPPPQLIDRNTKNILDEYLRGTAAFCLSTLGPNHSLSGFWSTISSMSDWNT